MSDVRAALARWAPALARHRLDALLVGGAAAVAHGVPLVTHDLDFVFVDGAVARRRLSAVAAELGCTVQRPYYRRSLRWRLEGALMPADFVCALDGARDLAALFARAERFELGGAPLAVASLADVLRSKRAAARPGDEAALALVEAALQGVPGPA